MITALASKTRVHAFHRDRMCIGGFAVSGWRAIQMGRQHLCIMAKCISMVEDEFVAVEDRPKEVFEGDLARGSLPQGCFKRLNLF